MTSIKFTKAFITGASSGIGEALCNLLANKGISLLLTGRNEGRLQHLQQALQHQVEVSFFVADLGMQEGRQLAIKKMHQEKPDLVVNNAGFGLYGEALTYETSEQMEIVNVNLLAPFELTLEAARTLISSRQRGVILNVSSAAAFDIFPTFTTYTATKTFINAFSQSLDFETQPYGVRVFASCPGMVSTSFAQRASGGELSSQLEDERLSMTSAYAAEQIWQQIEKEKIIHIFDWRYRVGIFLSHFFPQKWLAGYLKKRISARFPPRSFLSIHE
ncbi:putative uncharacterized protein [Parachlamydia acanthamoebae UV-7]|jgi:short-subunit dehydrogenase|uniref:Uncharacterized protein n=1 Tax=Parachlamydia acanthamoebae (strain UV7) TaxID=765952 RepID=F8L239_PARAV|nr:SDR family NAD(P)-dependent oxidoreductase [Parachlamydia acanthamoebae]CCB87363.1 putative uncharacterized protein [Parachlamydia acanthamoebae UV-7]